MRPLTVQLVVRLVVDVAQASVVFDDVVVLSAVTV
jgi:hypothetical protein